MTKIVRHVSGAVRGMISYEITRSKLNHLSFSKAEQRIAFTCVLVLAVFLILVVRSLRLYGFTPFISLYTDLLIASSIRCCIVCVRE